METDHKPLERIYSATSKPCAHLERWVLYLQSYDFKVVYRPREANIADALSRLNFDKNLDVDKIFDYVMVVVENSVPVALTGKKIDQAFYDGEELKRYMRSEYWSQ